jgi:peptidoglycan/LPS O-acetylase OafA/YrhL
MSLLYGDLQSRGDALDFYRRRLSRLLPTYYAVLILSLVIAAIVALPNEFSDVERYGIWSAGLAPNIGFWLDASYFDHEYFRPTLNFWSLGVELQFYLLFPLIVRVHRRHPWLAALGTIASLALYVSAYAVSPKTAFFMTPCRVWQFMLGFYVARLRVGRLPLWLGSLALVALVLLVTAAPLLPINVPSLVFAVATLAAIFIAAGLPALVIGARPARIMAILGRYSYSIYLVHFPVIAFLAYHPFEGTSLILSGPVQFGAALALTAVLAVGLYHFVETPLRRPRRLRSVTWLGLTGSAVAAGLAAALGPLNGAMLSAAEYQAASAAFDRLPYRCPKLGRLLHPLDRSCLIAGQGGVGFLLVGDSHADVMKDVLGEEVQRVGGNLRLMVQNFAIGEGLTPEDILDEAERRRSRTIILHSWQGHFRVDAIGRLAAAAARRGIKIAVIEPVPQPGFNVPEFIYGQVRAGHPIRPRPTPADFDLSAARDRAALQRLTASFPNIRVYQPRPFLCMPLCAIQSPGGQPYYSDDSHLTQTGARVLIPLLRNLVLEETGSPSVA